MEARSACARHRTLRLGRGCDPSRTTLLRNADGATATPSRPFPLTSIYARETPMNIAVFGMGYVGSVSAATFADDGHTVIGVDVNQTRWPCSTPVRARSSSPACQSSIALERRRRTAAGDDEPARGHRSRATCRSCPSAPRAAGTAASTSRISPASASRSARPCSTEQAYHVVVIRSTVLPGTTHETVIPDARTNLGQALRHRLRRLGQPGVSPRGERRQGHPASAADSRRPQSCRRRRRNSRALRRHRRADRHGQHPRCRDDEVREQRLARAEGLLRQRDRQRLQAARGRQPRGDGHLLPGRQAESVAVLSQARLRLRRVVPAQGRAGARVSRQGAGPRSPGARVIASQQPASDPAGLRPDRRDRKEARRTARIQLQGRNRRPAREPDGHPGGDAARQGLRRPHLRSATSSSRA